MSFQVIQKTGHYTANVYEYVCDTRSDIASLPTSGDVPQGSTANVIADGSVYKINSSGTWVEQPSANSGGAAQAVTVKAVEDDDYLAKYEIYQGETLVGTIVVPLQTIEDGSIGKDKLSTEVQTTLDAVIPSEAGANNVRIVDGVIQYKVGDNWTIVNLDGLTL